MVTPRKPNAESKFAKLQRLEELRKNFGMLFYAPYGKQREFHNAGKHCRERLLMAGNKLGKCVTGSTLIDTPNGSKRADEMQEGDEIFAWDGKKKIATRIQAPFQKPGLHECYKIVMSDGRWVEAADHHRILTDVGWHLVEELFLSAQYATHSSQDCSQIHVSDVRNWWRRLQGFVDRCFVNCHLYDERLLSSLNNVQVFLPLQDDVLKHSEILLHSDDLHNIDTNNHLREYDHLSNWYGLRRHVGRFVGFLIASVHKHVQQKRLRHPIAKLLSTVVNQLLRLVGGFALPMPSASLQENGPYRTPDIGEGNYIIALIPIGRHKVFDFTVPLYHNYCAGGIVHHNTYAAGFECAFHATGIYPEDWEGHRFTKHNRGWAGSVTSELTRDGQQRILLGTIGRWGTGCIPKDLILEIKRARGVPDAVETVLVRHTNGDVSQITFKAYSDGREAWQAEDLDWVWFDEEPPYDIYIEGITRTNNSCGPVFLTFTPLLGMSDVVLRFVSEAQQDRNITHMTIDDVEHYSDEQKRKIIDSYPSYEREARAMGIPMLGSGRIFPVEEALIKEAPLIHVPSHWTQILGCDFGWDHPTAFVHTLLDPDADCIHITKSYKQKEQIPLVHAAAVRPWGATWVPCAWPLDGYQHDKGSGEQIAQQYRDLGLNFISEHATFGDDRGNGVEAGVTIMLERMLTGRLRVNENLSDWFAEFRMYHRKDGKIVKKTDDLLCATRYAMMMLRYAQPLAFAPKPRDKYARDMAMEGASWMSN